MEKGKKRPLSIVYHCHHVTSTKSNYSKSYAILSVNWWFSLKRCSRVTLLHCDQQAELTYRRQRSPWSQKSKTAKSWEDMTCPSCLARINCLPNNHQGLGSLRFFVNVLDRHGSDAQISLWQGLYERNPNPIHVSLCASDLKSCSQSFLSTSSLWSLSLEGALCRNTAWALLSSCFILFKYHVFLFAKLLNYNSTPKQVVFSLFFLLEPRLFFFLCIHKWNYLLLFYCTGSNKRKFLTHV